MSSRVYAIVRAGGRQEKVTVGDVVLLDRVRAEAGSTLTLPALLYVDGDRVTSASADLAGITVTAQVLAETKGPKIHILKYKNKTGYRKRMGYRSKLTRIKVTGIDAGGAPAAATAAAPATTSNDD